MRSGSIPASTIVNAPRLAQGDQAATCLISHSHNHLGNRLQNRYVSPLSHASLLQGDGFTGS
jgi:hypothetical protein